MAECRHRLSWNPSWRCRNRGLPRYCIEHLLDRFRWEWRWGNFRLVVDLSNLNRLILLVDRDRWPGQRPRWWSLDFGNSGCDPAFSIGWERRDDLPNPEQ